MNKERSDDLCSNNIGVDMGFATSFKSRSKLSSLLNYRLCNCFIILFPSTLLLGSEWNSWHAPGTGGHDSPGPSGSICTPFGNHPEYCYTESCGGEVSIGRGDKRRPKAPSGGSERSELPSVVPYGNLTPAARRFGPRSVLRTGVDGRIAMMTTSSSKT